MKLAMVMVLLVDDSDERREDESGADLDERSAITERPKALRLGELLALPIKSLGKVRS